MMFIMPDKKHEELAKEVLKKYDKESDVIEHKGFMAKVVAVLAIAFSLFQIYTAVFGVLDAQLQRAVHLGFGLTLVYLLFPMRQVWSREKVHVVDVVLAILGAGAPAYIIFAYRSLVTRAGTVNSLDLVVGLIGIALVIEATRRVVGMPMVCVVLFFLAYAFAGPYLPGVLAHRGLNLDQLVSHLFFTTEGVFGIPLGVSSTFIFLFILFGAYLESTGLGKFFIDLANAVAGWARGGPAKVAVLSSGLMGTVSGSSVANVAGTGAFTIPMMKKLGYERNFAGAVEAAASTGGQLMPPVMGAAAFLMAEFVGVPYFDVVKAATIPAILYFLGIWLGVHFEARRSNLKGVPRSELPKPWEILKERGHLAIPLIVIIYLLVSGFTPMRAALWAIVLAIAASSLRKSTRMKPVEIVRGLENGARNVLGVLVACASAGIIIGSARSFGRHAFADDVLYDDHVDHPRHGRADDGELRHYLDDCRSRTRPDGRARARGAHVRLLLRHHRRRDASRGSRCLRRVCHQRRQAAEDRHQCLEARDRRLHHSVHLRAVACHPHDRCNAHIAHHRARDLDHRHDRFERIDDRLPREAFERT